MKNPVRSSKRKPRVAPTAAPIIGDGAEDDASNDVGEIIVATAGTHEGGALNGKEIEVGSSEAEILVTGMKGRPAPIRTPLLQQGWLDELE